MTDRELMRKALETLETKGEHHWRVYDVICDLRDRLAQEQEPVAWVGLTDEEQQAVYDAWQQDGDGWGTFYALIEAKLKEKNHG